MQRYFVNVINDKIILKESDFHHIKDVMRIKNGGNIIVSFNNTSYLASISYANNNYDINLIEEIKKDNELTKNVILYQGLVKNDKFDLAIQKACELGVSDIYPTIMARSVVKIENDKAEAKKIERYETIIKEACEQSTRSILPTVHNFINLKDIKCDPNTLYLLAYENNEDIHSFKNALSDIDKYDNIAIIIGPEGGFDKSEVEYLLKAGFKNVSLGKRILRAETATMYALSVIGYILEG